MQIVPAMTKKIHVLLFVFHACCEECNRNEPQLEHLPNSFHFASGGAASEPSACQKHFLQQFVHLKCDSKILLCRSEGSKMREGLR